MLFRCWLRTDEEDSRRARDIEAHNHHDAAADACEWLHDHGEWSGDPIPHVIEVYVRDVSTDKLVIITVETEYTVSFYSRVSAVPATEPVFPEQE